MQDFDKNAMGFIDTHLYDKDAVKKDISVLPYPMSSHVYGENLLSKTNASKNGKREI